MLGRQPSSGRTSAAGSAGSALVDHDVNGLLVPPRDAAALAAAITRVLTEPDTAARLSAADRRTAERYAWPALAARWQWSTKR
jgi:glycosyltransferase involved in cell wall biosynthesis